MPICPKCGKSLCSEQALSYHLNKKFKCGTWKCMLCSRSFDTKLSLQLHEIKCGVPEKVYPDYSILRMFYDNSSNVCCEIQKGIVVSCNNATYIGHDVNNLEQFVYKNDNIIII